ncbi:MAG TPA: hypothetical protein PLE90_04055, partial [Dysgonamonadaceae bacterium]|nr:hypothetical protein [Dysgonamonadaceae bacterium]
ILILKLQNYVYSSNWQNYCNHYDIVESTTFSISGQDKITLKKGHTFSAPSPYQGCTILAPSPLQDFTFFAAKTQDVFTPNQQNPTFSSLP